MLTKLISLLVLPAEIFQIFSNPPISCLTAYQPTIRPTSGGRIGPVYSHHEEYRRIITNMLF